MKPPNDSLPTPSRSDAENLRAIEQPQRILAKWLRQQFQRGTKNGGLEPGGRLVISRKLGDHGNGTRK